MNCLGKVKEYREKGNKFDLDTRKIIIGLYRNNSFSNCRKEWLEIIDHLISKEKFRDAWQEILSLTTYCENSNRINLSLTDLEKYSKEFKLKSATNERKLILQRGIECSDLNGNYETKSSFSKKLAEAYHSEGKYNDAEKYLLDAASDLILIGHTKEANKLFETGEKWTAEKLYPGDIANYCLKKVALRYGVKDWTGEAPIQENDERGLKFQGSVQIEFIEAWTKKAAEYYKKAKKGKDSLHRTINSYKRDGRIPDSSKLKLAWIYYTKFEFLKLNTKLQYDDNEILSCISEATKVPKKFKTEYHDFFYTKLREIEKRQLEESKEIKQKTKKNDKETIKVKQNNIEKETENDYELQKEDTFREMIRVALKDGKIDENELETLRLGAKMGGINDRRVNELINEEKKLIKKEDKTIKKNKKEKINNMEFKSLSKGTECYICGEKGHLSYSCPEKNIKTYRKKLAEKTKKDNEK